MTRPGADKHSPGRVLLSAIGAYNEPARRAGNGFHSSGRTIDIQPLKMGGKEISQLIALDALGIAGVIFKGFGLQNLAARRQLLEESN